MLHSRGERLDLIKSGSQGNAGTGGPSTAHGRSYDQNRRRQNEGGEALNVSLVVLITIILQTSEQRINPDHIDLKKTEWLFPETTKNFSKLPLQYRVSEDLILDDLPLITFRVIVAGVS